MISYRVEQTINLPVAEVFPFLADPRLHVGWMNVSDVTLVPDGEVRVGTVVRLVVAEGSHRSSYTWVVTELSPGHRVGYRVTEGPLGWAGSFSAEPDGAGTRVISEGRITMKGWKRLLEPFAGGEVRRSEAAELARLKAQLEAPH